MNDKQINELVEKLDEVLSEHHIKFEEYLLYRAIHAYENQSPEIMESLEKKGLVKDGKVVDQNKIIDISKSLDEFLRLDEKQKELDRNNFLHVLSLVYLYHPAKPW